MKKTFKGFTLIECIVALAVLGVASLTMAQIYANVAMRNKNNHIVNSSLANQMAYVEKYTDSEAVGIYFNNSATTPDSETTESSATRYPPHKNPSATSMPKVIIVSSYEDYEYSYSADVYVLKSRDTADGVYTDAEDNNTNLRYKYVVGHSN